MLPLLLAAAGLAHAQGAADPTRPPLEVLAPVGAGATAAPAASGLQTVILRKGSKPMAVINGEMVRLGGRVGDARLVRLSETEAVLEGPAGREVLQLAPGVEKKIVAPAKASAEARKNKAKQKPSRE